MKENKKLRNRLVGLFIIAIMIASSAIVAVYLKGGNPLEPLDGDIYYGSNPNSTIPLYDFFDSNITFPIDEFAMTPTWNPITQDYRPRWTGCDEETFKTIFQNLPKFPQDFYKKYKMFMLGQLNDYERLGPEYWQQPEWYDLNQARFSRYVIGFRPYWNPGQVSSKPMIRMIEIKRGVTMNISTFFHNDVVGSETYLGGIVYSYLPPFAKDSKGVKVFGQPENADLYIHHRITYPQHDQIFMSDLFQEEIKGQYTGVMPGDKVLLFPPSRMTVINQETVLVGYPSDWVKKISLEVNIDSNCPPGDYVIAVDLKNAASSVVQEYNWEISSSPYYSFFYNIIRETHPACPYFQLLMTVV
jgi:hypothetical protein